MVVAIDATRQVYMWVNADGGVIGQYTDQTQPLEGEKGDAVIAEYWAAYQAIVQARSAAATAPV